MDHSGAGATLSLKPFHHQVGGHTPLCKIDDRTVWKPLNEAERAFYEADDHDQLVPFVPEYMGCVSVTTNSTAIFDLPKKFESPTTKESEPNANDNTQLEEAVTVTVLNTAVGTVPTTTDNSYKSDDECSAVSGSSSTTLSINDDSSRFSSDLLSSTDADPSLKSTTSVSSLSLSPSSLIDSDLRLKDSVRQNERALRLRDAAKPYHVGSPTFGGNPWSAQCYKAQRAKWNSIGADGERTVAPLSREFLMLQDLTFGLKCPCILDLKMGTQQHGPDASPLKRERQIAKCNSTTSATLGVRICGMQVYRQDSQRYFYQNKYYGRQLTADNFQEAISQFLFNGHEYATWFIPAFIQRLSKLYKVIELMPQYRFFGSSLLLIYDGHPDADFLRDVDLRLIDFAHTCRIESSLEADAGHLLGLRTLINVFENILATHSSDKKPTTT